MPYQEGQRVRLVKVTEEMAAKGIKVGATATVRVHNGKLGIEIDGYSDTGWNAGLHVTTFNTRQDGQTISILDLCEAISPSS